MKWRIRPGKICLVSAVVEELARWSGLLSAVSVERSAFSFGTGPELKAER
jgi:hypothetical protein